LVSATGEAAIFELDDVTALVSATGEAAIFELDTAGGGFATGTGTGTAGRLGVDLGTEDGAGAGRPDAACAGCGCITGGGSVGDFIPGSNDNDITVAPLGLLSGGKHTNDFGLFAVDTS